MDYLNLGALLVAVAALVVSFMSWRASVQGVRASTFDRRFETYSDVERFLGAWSRAGRPDLSLLTVLVGAWTRSHFLFSPQMTAYLRKIWTDAVNADYLHKVVAGEVQGDRDQAIERTHQLLREHSDYDKLREKFAPEMKV